MRFTKPTRRWAVAVGIALVAAVAVLPGALISGALTAHSSEHVEARGIDAACSRAAQDVSVTTEERRQGFADVEGNVHEPAISCLAHWSIAQGRDGAYLPGEAVRRDQMASFLARTVRPSDHSLPEGEAEAFADTAGNTHADNIHALAEAGVVEGRADGTYAPREPVSRAAMASFVARTLETVTGEDLDEGEAAFPDTEGVHEGNINALAAHGIVQGRADGSYGPDVTVRRDQMASFLARGMDYLAAQGHWPVPATVELQPGEDTNPANLVHRLRGTVYDQWGEDDPEDTYYAADVRVEVYREADGGHTLVHADRLVSGLGGSLSFAYNAAASAGDADVIAACPLPAGEDPDADAHWCADVDTSDGETAVVADEDRGTATVTTSWTDPVDAEPAGAGYHPGTVITHDLEQATIDLQTAGTTGPDGEREGERLLRVGYNAADSFIVTSLQGDIHDATLAQFECALQAAADHHDDAYPRLSAQYDPASESLFDLSIPADIDHCRSSSDFSRQERASDDFPGPGGTELVDVRAAAHDEFDRVVFELAGDPVSWEATWEEDPRLAGSGHPADVEGEAFLQLNMSGVARWADGSYDGPDRVAIDGNVATEAVMTGDFEGMVTWVVGLDREAPFRVDVLTDPQRLIVDVAS